MDELAFFNVQLAGLVKNGIALPDALRESIASLGKGKLKMEVKALEEDLANGIPVDKAIAARDLPLFYKQMLQVGVKSRDFPGLLTLIADHYQRTGLTLSKLRGLLTYPFILFAMSILLSLWFAALTQHFNQNILQPFSTESVRINPGTVSGAFMSVDRVVIMTNLHLWFPPVIMSILWATIALACAVPRIREKLSWKLPGFHHQKLAQFASAMHLLLRGGCTLEDGFRLMETLESGSPAAGDLQLWRRNHASGRGSFKDLSAGSRVFPPLFIWLAGSAGEDLQTGFKRAADLYSRRAEAVTETMLYAALPSSVIFVGAMIAVQIIPTFVTFSSITEWFQMSVL